MFVEEKKQGEVATKLKLSEAIRKGLPITKDEKQNWRFCALGAAFAGVHGRIMTFKESSAFIPHAISDKPASHAIADALGFDRAVCQWVNMRHSRGETASKIADWLEAQGY